MTRVVQTGTILDSNVYSIEVCRRSDNRLLMTIMDDRIVEHSNTDILFRVYRKDGMDVSSEGQAD